VVPGDVRVVPGPSSDLAVNPDRQTCRLYCDRLIYRWRTVVKFVSSREIRVNPRPVFEAAEEGDEVVITSRGKPVALLLGISSEDLDETVRLVRRARTQAAVSRMRKAAAREGSESMSREEIEKEISAARSERAAR
jgi:prevent-host-death family protein